MKFVTLLLGAGVVVAAPFSQASIAERAPPTENTVNQFPDLVDPAAAQPDRLPPQAITPSTGIRKRGGLVSLTNPNTKGSVDPLLTGAGSGVAGAAAGTQKTADQLGNAVGTFLHTLGAFSEKKYQGAGVAAANAAPAVKDATST